MRFVFITFAGTRSQYQVHSARSSSALGINSRNNCLIINTLSSRTTVSSSFYSVISAITIIVFITTIITPSRFIITSRFIIAASF